MILVGLTGGIGSGKSTVADLLAARGAVIVDADAIVHELQQPGMPVLEAIVERFGSEVLDADGALDRQRLAGIVFADPSELEALNAIVHPAVRAEIRARIDAEAGTDRVVVLDLPLLVDRKAPLPSRADGEGDEGRLDLAAVVVVDTPVEVAVERLTADRGMSEADATARIGNQISREERRALADHVIDNSGDLAALERQVDDVWAQLVAAR